MLRALENKGSKVVPGLLWMFPAAAYGLSSLSSMASVGLETSALFLQSAPTVWRAVLEKIEALVRVGGLGTVLGTDGQRQIRFFVHFWSAESTCPGRL
jgi:hypothetical protein